ncbi:polysaccharide pyruvyl transferase family protein [Xanthobacter sp. V4C-4]|uniref:polysaccharide pyruvyl transferase family protein n=1 Tax=Xanthobacter cornucopiae TaxID=3119924 RepID=UPI00372699A9
MEPFPVRARTAALGAVPLVWAAATADQSHINLGDALSPVMVALLSSLPVVHAAHSARGVRMAAVGTIGHMLQNGDVTVWGTGVSRYCNPHAVSRVERVPFAPYPGTRYRVAATRGPVSRALFNEENAVRPAVFGDPVWLLPQFHRPPAEKKWDLGVIVHLSELNDKELDTFVRQELQRYHIPDEFRDSVRIIHTRTAISADALRARLDEILACRRLVSTSLHGMVFAESYGIPCLYFAPRGRRPGLESRILDPNDGNDLRITDLYQGLGLDRLQVYVQARRAPTDWAHVMRAIDEAWEPKPFDYEPLLGAFPLDVAPLHPPPGQTVFDHPLIRGLPFQQTSLLRGDAGADTGLQRLARLFRKPAAEPRDAAAAPPQPSGPQ